MVRLQEPLCLLLAVTSCRLLCYMLVGLDMRVVGCNLSEKALAQWHMYTLEITDRCRVGVGLWT